MNQSKPNNLADWLHERMRRACADPRNADEAFYSLPTYMRDELAEVSCDLPVDFSIEWPEPESNPESPMRAPRQVWEASVDAAAAQACADYAAREGVADAPENIRAADAAVAFLERWIVFRRKGGDRGSAHSKEGFASAIRTHLRNRR